MSLFDFFRRPLRRPGLPASFAEARPHLMPALRGRAMAEHLRLTAPGKEADAPSGSLFLPFSSDAVLMLVHDSQDMMQCFGPAQLAQWGVSLDEALRAAMDKLRDATVDRFIGVGRGVFAGAWAMPTIPRACCCPTWRTASPAPTRWR